MALYQKKERTGRHHFAEVFTRRLKLSDEVLVTILASKLRYQAEGRMTIGDHFRKAFANLYQCLFPRSHRTPSQVDDRIVLTGMELRHLHQLCDFDAPEEINLQDDYLIEPQILSALLGKAEVKVFGRNL